MSDIKERLAYLQGLANGYNLREESKEGQILIEVLGVLDQLASDIVDVEDAQGELETYVESLDSDLSDLEGDVYGLDEIVELTCPECGTEIEIDAGGLDEGGRLDLSCPECGESLSSKRVEEAPHSHL